jgi:hypothetical protein
VIWGVLQNGRSRSFGPQPLPVDQVVERDRYAVSRRLGAVVDLVGVTSPPPMVLAAHYCAEYAESKRMRGMTGLGEALGEVFAGFEGRR